MHLRAGILPGHESIRFRKPFLKILEHPPHPLPPVSAFKFLRQLLQLVFLSGGEIRLIVLRVNLYQKHRYCLVAEVVNNAGTTALSSTLKRYANLAEPSRSGNHIPDLRVFATVETTS